MARIGHNDSIKREGNAIFDPAQPDGKPRDPLNTPEELAALHEVLDRHFGSNRIARVLLPVIEVTESSLEEGETVTTDVALEMLRSAVDMAGGVRKLAEEHSVSHALISKALAGKRKPSLQVLAIIGLKPDQVIDKEGT